MREEEKEKRLCEIGSKISKLIRFHGLTNKVMDEIEVLKLEQQELLGKESGVLDKLDDFTLERVKVFKVNMENNIQRKVEEKKEREEFEDPRDEKMMRETYPDG